MLFGLEIPGLVRFFTQASAAAAGASALWIFIFYLKNQKELARILTQLFLCAVSVFLLSVTVLIFIYPEGVGAHEGLRLMPSKDLIVRGLRVILPFAVFAGLFTFWGALRKKYGALYFFAQFVLWSVIISSAANTGEFSIDQVFYVLHGWHSILTLGTVLCVDFLFVAVQKKDELKRFLYPFFPFMSAAIWTGLGIDFVANMLVFEKVFLVTNQFLFTQAVVVIIIMNGALLSGKINGSMINLIKPGGVGEFTPRMKNIAEVSGALSITSWVTITFIDGLTLTASYYQLMAVYILAIFAVYFLKPLAENGIKKLVSYA